jgi:hypothetical protein
MTAGLIYGEKADPRPFLYHGVKLAMSYKGKKAFLGYELDKRFSTSTCGILGSKQQEEVTMAGGMAQVVKCLLSKHKALSSNPTTAKQINKKD